MVDTSDDLTIQALRAARRRASGHPGRRVRPPHLPRRAAAAVERGPRRHVARRAAAGGVRTSREQVLRVGPGVQPAAPGPGGTDGLGAGERAAGQTSIVERARFDNQYIEHWSLWRDVAILLRTAGALGRSIVGRFDRSTHRDGPSTGRQDLERDLRCAVASRSWSRPRCPPRCSPSCQPPPAKVVRHARRPDLRRRQQPHRVHARLRGGLRCRASAGTRSGGTSRSRPRPRSTGRRPTTSSTRRRAAASRSSSSSATRPQWANGSTDPKVVPSNAAVFNTFVNRYKAFFKTAVQRYGNRVKHWEVWTEPNENHYWQPLGLDAHTGHETLDRPLRAAVHRDQAAYARSPTPR